MRGIVVLLGAIAALAVAGCGGSSSSQLTNDEYGKRVNQILEPVQSSLKKVSAAGSKAELESALDAADSALQRATQDVSALDPPSAATAQNSDLVAALGTYEKSISQTLQIVRSGTSQQVRTQALALKHTSQALVSSLNQIQSQLASQGIKVGK